MLISVIIPLHNKENFIIHTINSVLNQTYSDIEIIVIDDGSTDDSITLIKSLNNNKIQLYSTVNGGASKARNIGVTYSKGDWIAFLDADDEYHPDFIKNIVEFINDNQGSNLAFVGSNYYYGNNKDIANNSINSGIYNYFELFKNLKSPNNTSSTVVDRMKFLEVNGFPEGIRHFEDWITWFKLANTGSFGYIDKPLSTYNEVSNSISKTLQNFNILYNDAKQLIITINNYLDHSEVSVDKKMIINYFSLNISLLFARNGKKLFAIKMLHYCSYKLFIMEKIKFCKLIYHIIIPQCLKFNIWKTKIILNQKLKFFKLNISNS
jgi:glycosyltransferase involved in cell wall biosynthesis